MKRSQSTILLLLVVGISAACARKAGTQNQVEAAGPNNQASGSSQADQHLSSAGDATFRSWIDAGTLASLKWPNFSDYRAHVQHFYGPSNYALAWIRNSQPTPQATEVIAVLQNADNKGLHAEDYDGSRWAARVDKLRPATSAPADIDLAEFDLALTVCLMRYISDLHIGRVNPHYFHFGFDIEHKKYDLPDLVREQVLTATDITTALAHVEPPFPGYQRTQKALEIYRKLASQDDGEALPVPAKPIPPGQPYTGVPRLTRLLRLLGDLPADAQVPPDSNIYSGPLVDAVKHFQQRHGLDTDGRINAATVQQLNVPLSQRVHQLELTLERWRWVPHDFPRPPVVVNIPEFRVRGVNREGHVELTMNVVVGRAYRSETPVFSDNMEYVIFRPYWNVTPSIQRSEMVPKLTKDRDYLAKHDLEAYNSKGEVVASAHVSNEVLEQLRSGKLSIRQRPGPENALGPAKFIFPNQYNVYLHGSPAHELFARSRRDFSHGCIRVEDPMTMALWVLQDQPDWTRQKIQAAIDGTVPVQVNLKQKIPVLIVYATAVVLENGDVEFFDDIYGHDRDLEVVLAKGYPYPG
ncbi:MAG TPA: L,D-transpeptidase family protein [Terriglobales bacterium]|nr:L,D-transpeptidase family protein [Terriglobales bacterium]